MIKVIDAVFSEKELFLLNQVCENFVATITPNKEKLSSYYRNPIETNGKFIDVENRIINIAKDNTNCDYFFDSNWINKVDKNSNKDDALHLDLSDLSLVVFLNEDFLGGNLKYVIDNEEYEIKPKKNLGVLMNNKILHRVNPVSDGVRYTFVSFMKFKPKNKNSLI